MYEAEFLPQVRNTMRAQEEAHRAQQQQQQEEDDEDGDEEVLNEKDLKHQNSLQSTQSQKKLKKVDATGLPVVPPKTLRQESDEDEEAWFFVQSPREEHGAVGPYLLDELRSFRRLGLVNDRTLMWKAEMENWKPLGNLKTLKNRLLTLPPIPQRESHKKKIDNPILDVPAILNKSDCQKLAGVDKFGPNRMCSRCGAVAATYLQGSGEQRPDFKVLRQSIGNFQDASEVIPGLLWIGNSSTGRSKFLIKFGMDLSINCTNNLKTPDSKPPHYRCKQVPFKEEKTAERDKESRSFSSLTSSSSNLSQLAPQIPPTIDETLELFDVFYDMVEIARVSPERLQQEDDEIAEYRGGLDRYGRPIRSKEEQALWKVTNKKKSLLEGEEKRQLRILAWSRLGFDRPCAAAAAYLIRKWGLTLDYAIDVVSVGRIGTNISPHYMEALQQFSKKHSLGDMLCTECAVAGCTKEERSKDQHMTISELEHSLPAADRDVYNKLLTAFQHSEESSQLLSRVVEIKSMFSLHRGFQGAPRLMELRLSGLVLGDQDAETLSSVLQRAGVLPYLTLLDLSVNAIGCSGVEALCSALIGACDASDSELTSLWLQHNRIGSRGGEAIARLLSPGFVLHTLDVEDNLLGDEGVASLMLSLIVPEKDLFENNEEEADLSHLPPDVLESIKRQQQKMEEEDAKYVGNQTITSLNISNNDIGRETMDYLAQVLKSNKSLKKLNMDSITTIKPKDMVNFLNSCKVYNRTLTELTMTDSKLPASVVTAMCKALNGNSRLSRIGMARCELADLHLIRGMKHIETAKCLTELNLSGNPLSDGMVPTLCSTVEGKIDHSSGAHIPPLRLIDVSDCRLTMQGALKLAKAVAGRGCMKHLDLSSNDLTADREAAREFAEALQMSCLHTINLSRCQLGTIATEYILQALSSVHEMSCGYHLRQLLLSENDIHDRIDQSLQTFLAQNVHVQLLDLGFNKLTSEGLKLSREAVKVYSTSSSAMKLHDLHINLLGNPCAGEYPLDMPGMSRSKVSLRLGHERRHDCMDHIQMDLREHYIDRKKLHGELLGDKASIVRFNECS